MHWADCFCPSTLSTTGAQPPRPMFGVSFLPMLPAMLCEGYRISSRKDGVFVLISSPLASIRVKTDLTQWTDLCGAAATADERNVLLYLTMRFAKTIRHIQGLQAYHSGDKLNVEVDIVLAEDTSLRDSHDLGESLQYVLESVPMVDRAFVHTDYSSVNIPSHMNQAE